MAEKATSFVVDLESENGSPSKQVKKSKNFIKVLRSKYCNDNEDYKFGYFGGRPPKKRTNSGGDAELGYLTNVCVSNSNIRTSGLQEQNIRSLCPNVVDLDISGNLLDSWSEILPLIQQLQNLKFLNIARNVITNNKETLYEWSSPLPNVENLVLNQTGIKWKDIIQLAKLLPQLKELHMCGNNYNEIPEGKHHGLHSVECLRLNDNHITSWDEVWNLRHLPKLKSLILSGNPLVDIHYNADDRDIKCICSCHNTVDDHTAVNNNKVTKVVDRNKVIESVDSVNVTKAVNSVNVTKAVKNDGGTEAAESDTIRLLTADGIVIDNYDDGATRLHDTTFAYSNNVIECLQGEVRQYCENILNSVIDEVIRNDIAQSDVLQGKGNTTSEHGENSEIKVKLEGSQIQEEQFKDKTLMKESESLPVVHSLDERECIEQLSREIVELILKRAFDFVIKEGIDESAVQRNPGFDQTFTENNKDCAEENKENDELQNGGRTRNEEFSRGDDSCCPCDVEPVCQKPFVSLETLCVSETKIGKWKHLSALRTFPALKSVRIKNVKLGSKLNDEDRRKLFLASLPNVKLLNGSEVTHSEREKSERFLLRHFYDKKLKPDIYHTLEKRHGQLKPLVDIDISKGLTDYVTVRFIYNGKLAFTETISVRSMADTLRNLIAKKIDPSTKFALLYHKFCNQQHGESVGEFQEIRGGLLPLSRLEILDGDEIHVDDSTTLPCAKVEYYLQDRQPDVKQN